MGDRMKRQHKELASGRWKEMSLSEQMANIGSEVSRALELLDFSLDCTESLPRLREVARLREAMWRKYFDHFNYAARK
jgi:hypothetical protein